MTADARQVERLRAVAESRLHADRPPYTRLVPVGAHVLIELLDAVEAHAALVGELQSLRATHPHSLDCGLPCTCWKRWLYDLLAATDTAADGGAR